MRLKQGFDVLSRYILGSIHACNRGDLGWKSSEMCCLHRAFCAVAVEPAVATPPADLDPRLVMPIGMKSDPFRTYGYLVGRLAEGHRIHMKCTGIQALHRATKSLAVARQKICDHSILRGDDICLRIIHQDGSERDRVSKFVIAVDRVPASSLGSNNTKERTIRSGVRKRVSELGTSLLMALKNGDDVLGKAMGPVGISVMMASYAHARWKLIKEGSDLICFPEYRSEEVPYGKEFEMRRVLNFMFRAVPFDAAADVDSSIGSTDIRPESHPKRERITQKAVSARTDTAIAGDNDAEEHDFQELEEQRT